MDRENVIKCKEHLDEIMEVATHLTYPDYGVVQDHCLAILALLKEQQETVDPIKPLDKDDGYTFLCSKCNGELFCGDVVRDHYCPTCGKRVKWEMIET